MPSFLHETLVEMVRERPVLAAELLGGPLGLPVPDFQTARLSPGELTDVVATEYRADLVVTLTTDDTPVLAVVVEAQLRIDHHKRRSWPAYVATLHARSGCPVALLVLSPDHRVAEWCAVPIVVGEPDFVLTPLVLGPGEVPVVTDPCWPNATPSWPCYPPSRTAVDLPRDSSSKSCWRRSTSSIKTTQTCTLTLYSRRCRQQPGTTWRP